MPSAKRLTIYSFGYWGWGTATDKLVRLMDTAEKARGKQPPFFVDIRARRNVRAPGFRENAFGDLVGSDRYRWMPDLGNKRVLEHKTGLQIIKPSAAKELLDLAEERAKKKQPVVFFCACEWPAFCHRYAVGDLLVKEAKKRNRTLRVVEWPGEEPAVESVSVPAGLYKDIAKGRKSIPITDGLAARLAGLPWCSVIEVSSKGEDPIYSITGPPKRAENNWYLPLPWAKEVKDPELQKVCDLAWQAWYANGYDPKEFPDQKK